MQTDLLEDELIQINHACNRFEQAWQNGLRPNVEGFLAGVEGRDFDLLIKELLPLEIAYRHRKGIPLSLEDCLSRFPDLDRTWLKEAIDNATEQDLSRSDEAKSEPLWDTATMESLGGHIDNYELIEKIGEGGFGIVYQAEQRKPMRRSVAIKILKPGMDSKQVMARFEAERQALAIMDHPNIARVYDAGATDKGRPYFVMELVRGVPITEYCDQCKLSIQERLTLFVNVCHAVQHAHQKGVIHRDIKPTNVLIAIPEGVPIPKVIDFGVAKAINQRLTENTLRTGFAQMLGTPLYMSPEQAEMSALDVDTRTDIYALGILLYELLTGSTPIEKTRLDTANFDEVRRLIREDEPPLPSVRLSTIGEIQSTIAERRRAEPRRYIQLIRGDLDWIVMKALEKDRTRRYPTASALAEDVVRHLRDLPVEAGAPSLAYRFGKFVKRNRRMLQATCFGATVLLFAVALNSWQAAKTSSAQRGREEAQRQTEAVASFLVETFRSPDPSLDGRTVTVADRLDQAVANLPKRFPEDSINKARMVHAIGETYLSLGQSKEAEELAEQSLDIRTRLLGEQHADTLSSASLLAEIYEISGRTDQAIAAAERITESPGSEVITEEVRGILARAYSHASRFNASIEVRRRIYESRLETLGTLHPDTLKAMSDLGAHLRYVGRAADSNRVLEESVTLHENHLSVEHPQTIKTRYLLAMSYFGSGSQEKGLRLQREVLEQRIEKLGRDHIDTQQSMLSLAYSYTLIGRRRDAIATYEDALSTTSASRTMRSTIKNNLSLLYLKEREFDRTLNMLRSIVDETSHVEKGGLIAQFNYASTLGMRGDWAAAAKHYEQLLANEPVLSHDRATQAMSRLGAIYAWTEDFSAMERYGKQILERLDEPIDHSIAVRLYQPFLVMRDDAESETFKTFYELGSDLESGGFIPRCVQGLAHLRLGNLKSARKELQRAAQSDSATCRTIAVCHLAITEYRDGKKKEAFTYLAEAESLGSRLPYEERRWEFDWHDQLMSMTSLRAARREIEVPIVGKRSPEETAP